MGGTGNEGEGTGSTVVPAGPRSCERFGGVCYGSDTHQDPEDVS